MQAATNKTKQIKINFGANKIKGNPACHPARRRSFTGQPAPPLRSHSTSTATAAGSSWQAPGGRGVEVGAADGARGVGAEPGVNAGRVEGVAADGEQAEGVAGGEVGEAHGALRRGGGGLEAQRGEGREDGGVQARRLARRLGINRRG